MRDPWRGEEPGCAGACHPLKPQPPPHVPLGGGGDRVWSEAKSGLAGPAEPGSHVQGPKAATLACLSHSAAGGNGPGNALPRPLRSGGRRPAGLFG